MFAQRLFIGCFWWLQIALVVGRTRGAAGIAAPALCAIGLYLFAVTLWIHFSEPSPIGPAHRLLRGVGLGVPVLLGAELYFIDTTIASDSFPPSINFAFALAPLLLLLILPYDAEDRPGNGARGSRAPRRSRGVALALAAPLASALVLLVDLRHTRLPPEVAKEIAIEGVIGMLRSGLFMQLLVGAMATALALEGWRQGPLSRSRTMLVVGFALVALVSWVAFERQVHPVVRELRFWFDAIVPLAILLVLLAARIAARGVSRAWLLVPLLAPVVQHVVFRALEARAGVQAAALAGCWVLGGAVALLVVVEGLRALATRTGGGQPAPLGSK